MIPKPDSFPRTLALALAAFLVAALFAAPLARAEEPAAEPEPAPAAEKPADAADAAKPPADAPGDEFRDLRNLYRENPAKAADGFRAFLVKYPAGEWADDAHYWLAMSLERAKAKRKDVLEAWEQLVVKFPESGYVPDALFAVGDLWQNRAERPEDYTQAIRAYQTFLDRFPANARAGEALLRLGEICDRLRNYDASATWFRRVLDEHAQSPFAARARVALAAVYLKMKKPADALALYEQLLKTELTEMQRVAARLGEVDCYLMQDGGIKTAVDACAAIREEARQKKTLEDYTDLKTREKLAGFYVGRKDYANAEAEYQAYLARFPNSEGALQAKSSVGGIRLTAGKPAEAREMFRAVAATLEPGAEKPSGLILRAMLNEAYTYELEKNFPAAKALYKKLSDTYPRTSEAREASRRLERIEKAEQAAKSEKK